MGLREGRDMFEVTQQCMVDWAWHLVSNTNAALNAGLCFSRDKCPLPFACWVLQRRGGGCSSGQFLEPSHSPTLLSPSESRSTTHMWAVLGTPGALGYLSHWTLVGQLSKEEFAVVVKTLHFQCRGWGFYPWEGNQDPTCYVV